jgi:3-dehydroquinate dehydratase-2
LARSKQKPLAKARPKAPRAARVKVPRRRSGAAARGTKHAALRIMVLSGPNLDRLGRREPHIYGTLTLEQIHKRLAALALAAQAEVDCRQSNHEGALIDWIGEACDEGYAGILINPGALTHTSYALYDALRGAGLPAIEVHLSNPDAREAFRRRSRIAPACVGRVAGFGPDSYALALEGLLTRLRTG